jgi:Sad1 / UNC-like C-terminal
VSALLHSLFHNGCRGPHRLRMLCRGALKPEKLLAEEDFSFLKNECAAQKWVAVELAQRVRIASLELVMLELYSSRVKHFELYGSAARPAAASLVAVAVDAEAGAPTQPWAQPPWELLGRFRAANKKGLQVRMLPQVNVPLTTWSR